MNNFKFFLKSHKGLSVILLVYLIFCFYFTSKINRFLMNAKYESTAEEFSSATISLVENEEYSFTVEPKNSNWSGISIFFDKIEEENPISVSMQICDESNNIVFSYLPDAKILNKAKGYFRFNFANGINAKNGIFKVKVFGTNINLKLDNSQNIPAIKLYGNLLGKFIIPFMIFFGVILLSVIFVIIYFVYIKELKIEILFLFGALIFGFLFMIIMPPLTIADECRHFDTAYDISNKFLGIKNTVPNQIMKRTTDLSIVPPDYMQNENWTLFNYYEEIWPHIFKQLKKPQDNSLISVYPYATKLNTYFFMYVFSAAGITIGRLLKMNFLFTFLLGRFFNLAFFVFVIFFALKKYNFGKTFFATFALAPMFIHQIVSYSYDSILLTLTLYFVIAISSIITEKRKISIAECFQLCLAIFIFASSKVIYFPLVFLSFFLKKDNFESLKSKRLFFIAVLFCLVASFAFDRFYQQINNAAFNIEQHIAIESKIPKAKSIPLEAINAVTEMTSVKWVLKNPFTYAYILLNTLSERCGYYLITSAGGYLGWEAIPMNKLLVSVLICLFVFQILRQKHDKTYALNERPIGQRFVIFAIFLFIAGAVFTSLNLLSPPDFYNPVIGSVQGRYFLPIFPLIYLCRKNTAEPVNNTAQNIIGIQFFTLIMFTIDLSYRIIGIY